VWDEPYDIEEIEERSTDEERVLVAVVPSVRDWEIIQAERWYRIPVKRAPDRVGVHYLAFYYTGAFDDPALRWQVAYYAAVEGYRLARRVELLPNEPDHPRARDEYYKVELGPLQRLPHPIPSRRLRRVTFIPTTLTRLLAATEINDLWDRETAKGRLWRALRESDIPARRDCVLREGSAVYRVDVAVEAPPRHLAIYCMDGPRPSGEGIPEHHWLISRGWEVLTFTAAQVMGDVDRCARTVRRWVEAG